MIEGHFTGLIFDENGKIIGSSFYFYDPERQIYEDYKSNKAYKRMKTNGVWTEWHEITE